MMSKRDKDERKQKSSFSSFHFGVSVKVHPIIHGQEIGIKIDFDLENHYLY